MPPRRVIKVVETAEPAGDIGGAKINYEEERKAMWMRDTMPNTVTTTKIRGLCEKCNSRSRITILYKKTDSEDIVLRGGYYRKHTDRLLWLSGCDADLEVATHPTWLKYLIDNIQSAYISKEEGMRIIPELNKQGAASSSNKNKGIDKLLSELDAN